MGGVCSFKWEPTEDIDESTGKPVYNWAHELLPGHQDVQPVEKPDEPKDGYQPEEGEWKWRQNSEKWRWKFMLLDKSNRPVGLTKYQRRWKEQHLEDGYYRWTQNCLGGSDSPEYA